MNYIGSKRSLLPVLQKAFDSLGLQSGDPVLDVFGGTAIVSCMLRAQGYAVTLNEWQAYGRQLGRVWLQLDSLPAFTGLLAAYSAVRENGGHQVKARDWSGSWSNIDGQSAARVLGYLQDLPVVSGAFSEAFGERGAAGRLYFSCENARRIQTIRDRVETWREAGCLTDLEYAWLLAVLVEAADRVANTASVYGAHLKQVKATAQRPLELVALVPDGPGRVPVSAHRVFGSDAARLTRTDLGGAPRMMYVDPPYNARQYAANYHILETIVRWDLDSFVPRGLTGLRPSEENRSDFCRRPRVADALGRLLDGVMAEHVVVSYSNEGLLDAAQLRALIGARYTKVEFEQIPYARFQSDQPHARRRIKARTTEEWLVIGRGFRASRPTL